MNRHDPLTPEERDLARLLGRPQDHGPTAAVDAAILAAARAAVQANPAAPEEDVQAAPAPAGEQRRRKGGRRARWPTVFGVAASVVFAVGLAWQMRPEPPPVPMMAAHAPVPASAPMGTADADKAGDPTEAPAASAPAAADAPMRKDVPPPRVARAAVGDVPSERPHPSAPAAPQAAPQPYATPPASVPAPAVAAVPHVAEASRSVDATARPDAPAASVAERAPDRHVEAAPAMARSLRRAPATGAPGVMGRIATPALSADEVQGEVLADSQLSRRKWLQKIRHRRDAGEVDLARASLERYLLQYPESRLPRDLQPLLSD